MKIFMRTLAGVLVIKWWIKSQFNWFYHKLIQAKVERNFKITLEKLEFLENEEKKLQRAKEKAQEHILRREEEAKVRKAEYEKRVRSFVNRFPEEARKKGKHEIIDMSKLQSTDYNNAIEKAAHKYIKKHGALPKKGAK